MKTLRVLTITALLALGVAASAYAQFTGGTGSGYGMAAMSSGVVINAVAADTNVKLIRAGQAVATVARTSGISAITFNDPYPNSNLKVGQQIVVDANDDTFDGTFLVTGVGSDYRSFTYSQALGNVTSKAATGSAGGHYTSLTAWEAAVAGDLVTLQKMPIAECYNDWSGGLNDNLIISGGTSSAAYHMKIAVPASERNNGSTLSGFRIAPSTGEAINIADTGSFATIENIELIRSTQVSSGATLNTAGNMLFTGGVYIMSPGILNAGNSNMVIATSYGAAGTFNAQGSTITFNSCAVPFNVGTFNPNQSAITFSGALTWTPVASATYYNVSFVNSSGSAQTVVGTTNIAGNLILNTNAAAVNGGTINLSGDLVTISGAAGTTAVNLTNTIQPQYVFCTAGALPALTINKTGQTAYITGTATVQNVTVTAGTLRFDPGTYTVVSGKIMSVAASQTLNFAGVSQAAMVTLTSSGNWTLTKNGTVTATYVKVNYSQASSTINATNSADLGNNLNWVFGLGKYKYWTRQSASGAGNFTDAANWLGGVAPLTTDSVIFDEKGTADCNLTGATTVVSLTNAGAYIGKLSLGANNLTVSGDLAWQAGTLDAGTSTVILNGTIGQTITSGGKSFYNITITNASAGGVTFADGCVATGTFTAVTPSTKLIFKNGATYTFTNISINGTAAGKITMRSLIGGSEWSFNASGTPTVSYVSVRDSNASGSGSAIATTYSSDGGNNTNWNFSDSSTTSDRYWIGTATDANATGASWMNTVNWSTVSGGPGGASLPNSTNSVYFDAAGPGFASPGSTSLNMYSLNVGNGYIRTIYFQNPGVTITIGAGGFNMSSAASMPTRTLIVAGDLSVSAGTITLADSTNYYLWQVGGNYNQTGGTVNLPRGLISIGGNFSQTAGTFTHNKGIVDFTAASGTQTLTAGSSPFYNLTHSGAGTLQPASGSSTIVVNNNFTNSAGNFDNSNNINMNIGGSFNLTGTGTFTPGTSTVTFNGITASQTLISAGKSFYKITMNTAGPSVPLNIADNLKVTNLLTLTAGTLNLDSRTIDIAGGGFTQSAAAIFNAGSGSLTGSSNITGLNVSSGTLSFTGGSTYTTTAGSTANGITLPAGTGVIAIAGGSNNTAVLKADGTVWAWGINDYGQLGDNTTNNSTLPVQVLAGESGAGYLTGVTAIAARNNHVIALKSDGTVYAWGYNAYGQLGNNASGAGLYSSLPVQVKGVGGSGYLTGITAIAAGWNFSLALRGSDGTVYGWGLNMGGYLADNTITTRSTPVQALKGSSDSATAYLTGVTAIAATERNGLALKADGTVYTWGLNSSGQLGNNALVDSWIPVQVGGTTPLNGVTVIAGGNTHMLAIMQDGTVRAWGANTYGTLGDDTTNNSSLPVQVKGVGGSGYLNGIVAVASGANGVVALKSDGTVYGWGINGAGQLGDGTTTSPRLTPVQTLKGESESATSYLTGIAAINVGASNALALKSDGTVYGWGTNYNGQLGNGVAASIATTPVKATILPVTGSKAIFNGTSYGNMVTLRSSSSGSKWYYNNIAGTTTTANYVDVKDSDATTSVTTFNSVNSGNNNANWIFPTGAKFWLGATSSDWNTAANWSGSSVPVATDVIVFNGSGDNPCTLDQSRTVAGISVDSSYTNAISLGANTMTITGTADFTGGTLNASSSTVVLSGTSGQTFTSGTKSFNNITVTNASGAGVTFADGCTVTGTFTAQTPSTRLIFKNAATYAFTNISISGQALATKITMQSLSAGAAWLFNVSGTKSVAYVAVSDSNAAGSSSAIAPTSGTSSDAGNNTNWTFGTSTNDRYWIGSASNPNANTIWESAGNWATTSGGAGGASVPSSGNAAYFDAAGTGDCTIDTTTINTVSVSIASGYTGTITAPSGTLSVAGNWIQAGGTFSHNYGKVDFTAASGTQSLAAGAGSFYNLTHSGAGTLQPASGSSTIVVNNNFTNSAGNFDNSNNINMNIGGSFNLTGTGTFTPGTSTVTFNGITASQTLTSAGKSFYKITMNTAGSSVPLNITDNLKVTNLLTLTAGTLNLNSYTIDIAGGGFTQSAAAIFNAGSGSLTGSSNITGLNVSSGTLSFTGGSTYTTTAGSTANGITLPAGTGVIAISTGSGGHSLALKSDGTVYAWGANAGGQLGNNDTVNSSLPVQVLGVEGVGYLTGITAIKAGYNCSFALRGSDGAVYAWGRNTYGQLGNNTEVDSFVPVRVLNVAATSATDYLTGVTAIAASGGTSTANNSFALKSDGTVYGWGANIYGQLGDGTANPRLIPVQVLKGASTSTSGYLEDIIVIAPSGNSAAALKSDGTVYAWGYNGQGQLGNNVTNQSLVPVQVWGEYGIGRLTGITAIAASHSNNSIIALRADGSVYAWGGNTNGQLGNNTTTSKLVPTRVLGGASGTTYLEGITAVYTTQSDSFALKSDGSVYAWGYDGNNTLGVGGTSVDVLVPAKVRGVGGIGYLTDISSITGGTYCALVLKGNGIVYAWGYNPTGVLGDNSVTQRSVPVTTYLTAIKTDPAVNFAGTSYGNMVTLRSSNSGSKWYYNNIAGTTTTANYVDVKDSDATTSVTTSSSINSGNNNANWVFDTNANFWKGTTSSSWNVATNWSKGTVPVATDIASFGGSYDNVCSIDTSATVAGIVVDSTYTKAISLGANTLTVTGNADFTGGVFNGGTGTLRFAGSTAATFTPGSGTYNNIEMGTAGAGTLSISGTATVTGNITQTNGSFSGGAFNVAGNVSIGSAADGGSIAITLNGTTAQAYSIASGGVAPTGDLIINKTSGTTTISGTTSLSAPLNNIAVNSGALTFSPGTYYINDTKAISVGTSSGTATLNFTGTDLANMVILRSTSAAQWDLTKGANGTVNAAYVDVEYSNASASITAANSVNRGNNTNWVFPVATLGSWDLNMNTKKLTLNFTNGVNASSILPGLFTLQNSASSPTASYTLNNSSTASSSGPNIIIDLSTTDFNAIVDTAALCKQTNGSDSFLSISAGVTDMAEGAAVATVSGRQVTSYTANTAVAAGLRVATSSGANNTTVVAGAEKDIVIKAYDASGYRTRTYTGSKTVIFSGAVSSTDNNAPTADTIPFGTGTDISFADGKGAATIVLYKREIALIKAAVGGLVTDDLYVLRATVGPDVKAKLIFTTQPSTAGTINVALPIQPVLVIRDQYGNLTNDADTTIALYASKSGTDFDPDVSGILRADPTPTVDGVASFAGVRYDKIETVYIFASSGSLTTAFSINPIVFTSSASTKVLPAVPPQSSFNITPTNDTQDENITTGGHSAGKFTVLKFRIQDDGDDVTPTLIDRIRISIAGSGANALTDIAWAELRADDGGDHQVAIAASIANDGIIFGTNPDAQTDADLDTVPDGATIEYTVKVHMKPSRLTALDKQTYIFNTSESLIGIDSGTSSRMRADSSAVAAVIGTIVANATHLEIVDYNSPYGAAISITAGTTGNRLQIRGTDANKNVDVDYVGVKSLIFSGLSSVGINSPYIGSAFFPFGTPTNVNFTLGKTGVVNLTAFAKVTPDINTGAGYLSVADEYASPNPQYVFPCAVTVDSAAASSIGSTSGDGQSGLGTRTLANPLVVTVRDLYGNPVNAGTPVSFTISSVPVGGMTTPASIDTATTTTNSSGQASTRLTLGSAAGVYQVQATSGTLSGSPVTFSATARVPTSLTISSGNVPQQSALVSQQLAADFVIQLKDSGISPLFIPQPVSGETVNFAITTQPTGAGAALSSATATTDADGKAGVRLTLGTKAGVDAYVVTASYGALTPVAFTASATQEAPYKVVLTGPASVRAGVASTAFTLTIKDQYDNASKIDPGMAFNITADPLLGAFYSDAACTTGLEITTKTVPIDASTAAFYFKSNVTGTANVAVTTIDTRLNAGFRTSSIAGFTVMPESMHHFKITAADSTTMTAGESKVLTIKAYDVHENVYTEMNDPLPVTFTGANTSPSPSSSAPTCSATDENGTAVAFGTPTTLSFSGGVAKTTFKPYKAEAASIVATSSTVTSAPLALTVKHGTADHLKLQNNLQSPKVAGTAFNFDTTLDAVDLYSNLCDGTNLAPDYTYSNKTINWLLKNAGGDVVSGDGPENGTAAFTSLVSFTNGRSTTTLSATLYRAQTITITPSVTGLSGVNVTSNEVIISPATVNKITFSQQPSTACLASQPLDPQPWVAIADQYGNACTNVSAQITLTGSTTTGTYTPVTLGTLRSTTGLVALTSAGVAKFTGVNYTYPEQIYIRAYATISGVSVSDIYSYLITFSASKELSMTAVTEGTSATISSMANASANKVDVFKFKITDGGTDGLPGVIRKIIINRSGTDTSTDWTQYINDATISDGTNDMTGAIEANSFTFGADTADIYTVPNNGNRTYTLSLTLKKALTTGTLPGLPVGADGKILGFSVAPNVDITLKDTASSTFQDASAAVTAASTVDVTATNLVITGNKTMNAGASQDIVITAKDANRNIDLHYDNQATGKSVTFSGAAIAASSDEPTCTNYTGAVRPFGTAMGVYFAEGVSSSTITMKLYKAETAGIVVTDSSGIASSGTGILTIVVSGGAGSQLSWSTKPRGKIVANAPWKEFIAAVTDVYGNTASDNREITISMPIGISLSPGASNKTTASSGLATFSNFAVRSDDGTYPKSFYLVASGTTGGITPTGDEDSGLIQLDEKYKINFIVKDSVSAATLSGFNFVAKDVNQIVVIPETTPTTNPFQVQLPYGTYTFNFDLDKYVTLSSERGVNVAGDAGDGNYDNIINWAEYMTTLTESTADYRVMTSFAYDEDTETLGVRLWLERRGKMIVNNDINKLGPVVIETYEPSDPTEIRLNDINIAAPATTDYTTIGATYRVTIRNVLTTTSPFGKALESGKTYFVKCVMYYGGLDGMTNIYEGGTTFTVTVSQRLSKEIIAKMGVADGQTLAANIAAVGTSVAAVGTQVSATSAAVTAKVEAVGAQVSAANANVSNVGVKVDAVQTRAGAILDEVASTLPMKINAELAKGVISEMLTRYTILREDDSVKIRYRTASRLSPKMTIYKPDGTILSDYNGVTMKEISNTGIYEYEVTAKDTWGVGDFTVRCTEAIKGSTDSMVLTIKALYTPGAGVEESIDAVGEAVSKVYLKQKGVETLLGSAADVKSASSIFGKVNGLSSTVDGLNLTTVSSDAKNARMNAQNIYSEMENLKKSVGDTQAQAAAFKELSRQLSEMQSNLRKASQNLQTATVGSGGGTAGGTTTIIGGAVTSGSGGSGGLALSSSTERDLAAIKRDMAVLKKGAAAPTLKEEDLRGLNNRIEELTALVKLLSKMVETTNNKPVVEGWFEQG